MRKQAIGNQVQSQRLAAAIVGGALLLLTRRVKAAKVYREIDWPLLLMFVGLFIVVTGLEQRSPAISLWSDRSPNLIVVQRARAEGVVIGFWTYFKIGAPLTLLTLLFGVGWL